MTQFIEAIRKNCLLHADLPAVCEGDEDGKSINYGELWLFSSKVYAHLHRKGIGPEDVVMVHVDNTVGTIIACIGVLRAGAAFVIVGQDAETEALRHVYEDCGCRTRIDAQSLKHILDERGKEGFEAVDEHAAAYIIYTSGSTRRPKGAMLERGALALCHPSICYQGKDLGDPGDRVALLSPLTFAAGMILLNAVLISAATLYVASRQTAASPTALARYFRKNRITKCFMTPTLYQAIHEFNPEMKTVVLGGEPLTGVAPRGFELFNMYGQSESGFVVALYKVEKAQRELPIGCPQLESIQVQILDEACEPVENGETGELCYKNPFFRGYVGMEEETKHVLRGGILHTGDLCKRLPNGALLLTGRNDDMVKIHGLQVSTSEIEAAVLRSYNADQVFVRCITESTRVFICVYYTGTVSIPPEEARGRLGKHLPAHMLPTHFFHLAQIPTNRNGKVDVQRLPLPVDEPPVREGEDVPGHLEETIADIVRTVMEHPAPIGRDTNLISLGMSSLTTIMLIASIEETCGVHLSLAEVMAHPDIAHICEKVREALRTGVARNNAPRTAFGHNDSPETPAKYSRYLPLTKNQLAVFAECEANKDSVQYNIPSYVSLPRSELEPARLDDAIRQLMDLHKVFCTRIVRRRDVPAECFAGGCEVYQTLGNEPAVIAHTCLPQDFDGEAQEKLYFQGKVTPFDLFRDRLYRVEIVETPKRLYLFFDVHHIICDGYSLRILADEITRLLDGVSVSAERLTFSDYVVRKATTRPIETSDRRATQALLAELESFKYPYRLTEQSHLPHRTSTIQKEIPTQAIQTFCVKMNLTQSSYFHASLLLAIHLLTAEKPFIATTYSGRAELPEALMRTVGFFAKSMPLRWSAGEEDHDKASIRPEDYIRGIQAQIMDICSHDEVTYSDLAARSDILLTFQGEMGAIRIGRYRGISLALQTPIFPIQLLVKPVEQTYDISLHYDEALFSAADMALLFDAFEVVLRRLSEVSALREVSLTNTDPKNLIQRGSGRAVEFDEGATWVRDFERQVLHWPDRIAVAAENGTYTYRQLDEVSDKVASWLAERGVGAGDFVVVKMPRVKEFIAAILGIHKCGAAYVPVDVDYPQHRITYIFKDSEARAQLTQEAVQAIEAEGATARTIGGARTSGRAYMIYTSGSTGDPKGVVVSHGALYNYLRYVTDEMKTGPESKIACYASFCFDISIEGLLSPLIVGGTCLIVPAAVRKDASALEAFIRQEGVTGGCFPTQIGQLLGQREPLHMTYLTLIGERMTAIPGNKGHVYNAYGPTECTVVCTYYDVAQDEQYASIPIGRPMYNTAVLLLDPFGNLLPDGAIGELCVTGAQLAEGYHHKSERTAQAFRPLAQVPSVTVYHTGDLARRLPDGNLVFLGRADRQIKRSGYRIEPGEIENVARRLATVNEAVVKTVKNKLVLYYTLRTADVTLRTADRGDEANAIRQSLEAELPRYMLPDAYVRLESMPLTPNGKIDTRRLPTFELKSEEYVPPVNEVERSLCEAMARILHLPKVGMNDDFFDLGGNSLDAAQLALVLGEGFEVGDIYNGRTPSGILNESRGKRRFFGFEPQSLYPLTEEQKKFFFVSDMGARPEISYANVPMLFRLPDDADLEALRSMLLQIIDNHPYLKVRYLENPDPHAEAAEWYVAKRDDQIPADVVLVRTQRLDKESLIKPYNLLGDENMYRATLYEVEGSEKYLFWDFHHILIDAESTLAMTEDLKALMAGQRLVPEEVSGYEVALEERWRKEAQREEIVSYFRELLQDCDRDINDWINSRRDIHAILKRDQTFDEREGLASVMGFRVIRISECSVGMQYVRERCKALRITESMFFNAAFACLLGECNGRAKALYATVINNRDYAALKNTVTMLCRTVPVYLKVTEAELSSEGFLKQLRNVVSNAGRGNVLSYEDICEMNGIRFPRICMIYYERPANRELIPGFEQVSLNTLDSIDTIMLKVYYDEDDRLFLKFDTSLDFTSHEIDLMAERLDELISII